MLPSAPIRPQPRGVAVPIQRIASPAAPPSLGMPPRAVVQLAKWSYGTKDDEMSNQQWLKSGMSTFSSTLVEDEDSDELTVLGITKNVKTKLHGSEHAEDVAIRVLKDKYSAVQLNGLGVILNLSKSPCSSTFGTSSKAKGCAEELVDLVQNDGVNLSIICRGLYKGLDASQKAIDWMRTKGIAVSVDVRVGREQRFGEQS